MADDLLYLAGPVSIKIKAKIRYNGQEYSDPSELPPEVRAAYEKAMRGETSFTSHAVVKRKFVVNGQEYASEDEMPTDVHQLCDDVMSVIENNGEVTLPKSETTDPLITKRQLQMVLLVVGMLVACGLAALATR